MAVPSMNGFSVFVWFFRYRERYKFLREEWFKIGCGCRERQGKGN